MAEEMTSRWSLRYSDGAANDRAASRRRILMETTCTWISVAAAMRAPLCWSKSLLASSDGAARPSERTALEVGRSGSRSERDISVREPFHRSRTRASMSVLASPSSCAFPGSRSTAARLAQASIMETLMSRCPSKAEELERSKPCRRC